MATLLGGLVAGLAATIVMTAAMMALGDDSPPPTAALWAKYVGDGPPEQHVMQGMVLHLLYGVGAGGVFAVALPKGLGVTGVPGPAVALGGGLVYAVGLMLVGMVFWMNVVLGMEADRETMMVFGLFHLIYGVVLGAALLVEPVATLGA